MPKKTSIKNAKNEDVIVSELYKLIPQLDHEGLVYLVEQAKIHIYNMKVDEHNKAVLVEAGKSVSDAGKTGKAGKATAGGAKSVARNFSIKGTESGSSYYLYYGTNSIMFSRGEMTHLAKIANGPGTDLEIGERLYNWFDRERKDIFALVNIKNKFDEKLKMLVSVIRKGNKYSPVQ